MRLYRLYDSLYKADPLSGFGAYKYGARWNKPGNYALYTAMTPELALLEATFRLTHDSLPDYHLLILEVAEANLMTIDLTTLPTTWRERIYSNQPVQELLTDWFTTNRSLGIAVPSALIPLSQNVVLNPQYPDYQTLVTIIDNSPFSFS